MKNKIIFYLAFVLILFPHISLAVVNLPWSSTYNCNEWKTSDGQNPNCDSLWEGGGWTCDNGDGTYKEEQITATANYSGGGGGKGQRHWLGDGVNNTSGGMSASFLSSQTEIWVRWYMRYEQGFEWNPYLMNQKILYFDPVSFPRLIVEYYGQDKVQIYSYASSQGYPSAEGNGWNTMMANGGTDARGNKTSDGQWHLWEFHVKIDTNGTDGILELWIDNNMVINATNANLAAAPLTTLLIGSNGFTPGNGRCMFVDYDDITISNTGPIGGNTPPPSGGNPPPNNSGGDASASGGSGCGFVKDNNGKGEGAKGEGLVLIIMLIITLAAIALIKRYPLILRIAFLLFLLPINSYAATLEVGAGKTYSTIQAAVNAAQAGDTVLVYAGTYNQSNTYDFAGTNTTIVHVKNSGTATNPITIKAAGSGVILDGGGTINNCFWGRDLSYVVIDGFECRNVNVEAQNPKSGAIYFFKSNSVTIQNNSIYSIIQTDYENKACIFLQESNSCIIRGNTIKARSIGITNTLSQKTIIEGNTINGNDGGTAESLYANGIYVTNSSHDTVITKNYIHDYAYTAIQMRDSYRITFSYNVVYNGHGGSTTGGVCWGVQLRDWPGTGPDGNENDQYKVFNNVIAGPCDYGIVLTQQDNSVLENNIVLNVGSAIYETNWAAPVHSTNLTIKNNILNFTTCATCNFGAVTYTYQDNMENVDPKFVATGARPCPYYELQQDSPAKNAGSDGKDIGADACGTGGGDTAPPPPSDGSGSGDASASGGSGCGFVKEDGKGQGAKGEGLIMILLIIILGGVALARRASLLKNSTHIKSSK